MDLHPDRCPVELTVSVMGGKWKPTILYNLVDGPKRFNELRRLLPDVTQRMLTLQLRALEEDGVVARTDYGEVPPRVDYALTAYGNSLGPIIEAMVAWGERHKARGKGEAA